MYDDDYEPMLDDFTEMESSLGSAGMGTDEYYLPATPIDSIEPLHCNEVDPELFGAFSDCWKDDTGCRPRFFVTREYVLDWFKRRRENPPDWMKQK